VYLAVRISLDPSCTPYLIAYQRMITSANSNHPLHTYDMKFRTKTASEPTLRWDIFGSSASEAHLPKPLVGHAAIVAVLPIFQATILFAPLLHELLEDHNQLLLTPSYESTLPSPQYAVVSIETNTINVMFIFPHIYVRFVPDHTPPGTALQRGSPDLIKAPPWTPLRPFILE